MSKITIDEKAGMIELIYRGKRKGTYNYTELHSSEEWIEILRKFISEKSFSRLAELMNHPRRFCTVSFDKEIHDNYFFIMNLLIAFHDKQGFEVVEV